MSELIKLPVIYSKPVFRADRSVKLEFETREVTGMELAVLADLRETEGWLLYAPNELQTKDIPKEPADAEYKGKTPSQRLRGALMVWWEQQGKPGDKEDFYRSKMENLIDQVKEKLE